MVTILECLPDEILFEVCRLLQPFDLTHAFRYLNIRFDALLHDCRLFRHITIVSSKLAPNYTGNIITYGRRGIVQSLKATVRCRWLDLLHFNSLRKLTLLRPSHEQKCQFKMMISMTEPLCQLEQLAFIESDNEEYISRNIMDGVFPHLRQCHLFKWHNVQVILIQTTFDIIKVLRRKCLFSGEEEVSRKRESESNSNRNCLISSKK
jgi:hypothetical protein